MDPSSSFPPGTSGHSSRVELDRVRADGDLELDPSIDTSQVSGPSIHVIEDVFMHI